MARKILSLLALFIAFYLGAHFYIRWKNTVHDDVTKISRAVECQPNDFRALTLVQADGNKREEIRLERVDSPTGGLPSAVALAQWQWKIASPLAGEADAVLIRRIAATICELYDPIPVRETDFQPETATRRLAREVSAVLVSSGQEKKIKFEFGAWQDRQTVVRYTNESQKVRTLKIPDRFLQVTSVPPEEFRNLRVMRLDGDNVQRAVLRIDGKERFTLERAGADWSVLIAGKEKGQGSEEADRFVNRLSTLKALSVEEEGFSREACAKMPAKAVISFLGVADKDEELRFQYGAQGDLTGCSTRGTQKFRVHRDLVKYVDIPIRKVLVD